jgi:hypothetical protein
MDSHIDSFAPTIALFQYAIVVRKWTFVFGVICPDTLQLFLLGSFGFGEHIFLFPSFFLSPDFAVPDKFHSFTSNPLHSRNHTGSKLNG